jgi:hypothetical protein
VGVRLRDLIGTETICWECDYPHSDSTWPTAPERLAKSLVDVPDADVDRITHQNAMRHFSYDPFSAIPKEQCTVGALRAQAGDVDLSLRESKHASSGPPTIAALQAEVDRRR